MSEINHETERKSDVGKIIASPHRKKVVVAGPGTGKSFLFSQLLKKKISEGKTNFLAITFIGKLGDSLADDLCGLAETSTLHGFARKFVLDNCPKGWTYYPKIYELIKEDLEAEGVDDFKIGDENYKNKSKYYQAIGDSDVIHYAIQTCTKDPSKIPSYDLILIDEYQDFNAEESELVNMLSQKSEIVIVGDDDQALYGFKGSSPIFIREKYHPKNLDFESHTLRFCSRCTEVIVKYFHQLVKHFNLNDAEKQRIQKEYICYGPDKASDSKANPKIVLMKNSPPGMIAYKIGQKLEDIVSEQKVKSVLVLGEGQSCKATLNMVANQLRNKGFRNVNFGSNDGILNIRQDVVDAYKFLAKNPLSLLGWRILRNPKEEESRERHIDNSKVLKDIIGGSPGKLQKIKQKAIGLLLSDIEDKPISEKEAKNNLLFKQIKDNNIYLKRPLCNLDITVCSILSSKGLGADVVFVIGFDQGKFPVKSTATDSEVYQMLVAITRAKKRVYLVNTIGKKVSKFVDCLGEEDLDIEEFSF